MPKRRILSGTSIFLLAMSTAGIPALCMDGVTDDLPKHSPAEQQQQDSELKLMVSEVPLVTSSNETPMEASVLMAEVERLTAGVERAKRSAIAGERLFRQGVLAKVESEKRALEVVRLTMQLENARLEVVKQQAAAQRKRFEQHQIEKEEVEKADAVLAAATASAEEAATNWKRAELDAAMLNLQRKRQLFSAGIATKSEVRRAEDKVAVLKGQEEMQ